MLITVVGTGYVGLVTAVCLAEKGHSVICLDNNDEKINLLKSGISPIYESNLEYLMAKNKDRIIYTTNNKEAYENPEIIIIAVGTPEKKDGSANLQAIMDVSIQIAKTLKENTIIVIKSTVPIGTNEKIEKFIRENLVYDIQIEVVSNPEFLAQGTAVKDTLEASRIVIGVESANGEKKLKEMYSNFNLPLLITDRKSAEMIKYASNDFLALKISYINEIANLCEIIGANIEDVSKGMGMDPRIGNKFLNAGIGYGGSCFPKDTKALHWLGNYNDYELKTIKATIEINEKQKIRLLRKAKKYYKDFKNINIAILGLTFKPGTDDLREAPSLANIPLMIEEGANLKVWDPVAINHLKEEYKERILYCDKLEDTLLDTDICFIFTEWKEIKEIDTNKFEKLMRTPIILDGRNCFSLTEMNKNKVIYESIGRKRINNLS